MQTNTTQNLADLLGRLLLAYIFLRAGLSKMGASYAGTAGYMESKGVFPELLPLVILVEVVGALLIIVGYRTRLAALALSVFCVLAAVLFHMDFSVRMEVIQFNKNLAIAGGFLILFARGAGAFSFDHWLGNQRNRF